MRVGIVGLGPMGRRHAEAAAALGFEVVGGVDRRPEAAKLFTEKFPKAKALANVHELTRAGAELVCVATNGPSHVAIARDAIEHGVRRLVIEKPVATSLKAARELETFADKTKTRIIVNHARRYSPFYQELAQQLSGPELGGPSVAWAAEGGGALGCIGTHWLDLYRQLFRSEPVSVSGYLEAGTLPNPRGAEFVDPGGYAVVHFASGARLHLDQPETSGTFLPHNILCKFGHVAVDEGLPQARGFARSEAKRGESLTRTGVPLEPLPLRHEPRIDLVGLTGEAIRDAAGNTPPLCSISDGIRSLEMLVGLYASAGRGGERISLPLQDPKYLNLELSIT